MNNILAESLIILGLILLNGFFAAAEIAIIAMRRSKVNELMVKGGKRAFIIHFFQQNHEIFLATIQVGITLTTTVAAAYGGASFVGEVQPFIEKIPWDFAVQNATSISFVIVVFIIAYLSLVLGELVPKSLALAFPQQVALFMSYPIRFCSYAFSIFVRFLTFSSNIILKPFKDRTSFVEAKLSEEEIRYLMEEGREAGTIEKREHEFLENVFDFGDLDVAKIMVPQHKMTSFDVDDTPAKIIEQLLEINYSRIPVYEDNVDNIIGILYTKDILAKLAKKQKINVKQLLRPVIFIPTTQRLHDVLNRFKADKMHLAIVLDEHGSVAGLVTLEDILEEIVGEISDESDQVSNEIVKQEDGTYLVDGSASITDFNRIVGVDFKNELPEDAQFNSISGFILSLVRRFPRKGEKIIYENLQFSIKNKTAKRISSVVVKLTQEKQAKKS